MYPSIYPKNIKCHYRFRARSRQRIRILFEEVNLQPGDKSCLGREDSVKVYDGSNLRAPVITIICHFMKNVEVISSLQSLYVEFQSGLSNWPGNGFRAKYFFQTLPAQPANYLSSIKADVGPAVSATRSGCDRLIRSDSGKEGILTSPKFPLKYPSNTVCKYKFEGSGRERIQLIFQQFTLSNGENGSLVCVPSATNDYIEYSTYVRGAIREKRMCGHLKPFHIEFNSRLFRLTFKSNNHEDGNGFNASYHVSHFTNEHSDNYASIGNSICNFWNSVWTVIIIVLF
ncbi:hypothetical protein O3M35_007435 [Rhynocoris fuscipes]|uniref:CUB domain-containing protein n=1 Tax=Rhynocoris fuscipes TaxID=488301 RepID=A0AAW1DGU0_9HEMI